MNLNPEIYKDEGYTFMGAAFEIHNERGYSENFGHKDTLEWKRFILSEFIRPPAG